MRNKISSIIVVLLVLVSPLSACKKGGDCFGNCSTAPTPVDPDCQKNNTSTLTFRNLVLQNLTYEVWVEGKYIVTVAPGQVSQPFTVPAGPLHVQMKVVQVPPLVCPVELFMTNDQCSNGGMIINQPLEYCR